MANRQREPVSYRPFRTEPLLAEGLLAVSRPGGDLLERTSQALFRFAAQQGEIADRQAARAGTADGERAALEGRPSASITGNTGIGGSGRARGGRFAPEVNAAIDDAAARHGVDAATLRTIAQIESGGNPRAKNPTSSAGGLFQFIDSTASQYGLKDRYNASEAADAGARLMRDNRNHLRRVLGRDPTPGELYLAHQQGAGGAEKLLRNPNASAISVVGEKAVRLNGGRPGMTAGEFAQLWVRKAENGYSIPSEPSQIDPTITVTGGRFRPSGSDTIYGRAYNEAGTKAYLQMVDSEMRSTVQQAFELYKDDPARLETVLGTLKGQLKKDHIFPEIELDYELGFDNLSQRYLGQARENQRLKLEAQDRAEFVTRTNDLETSQQKLLADFDPNSPDAGEAIAGAQVAIDTHYDSAVDRGILSPEAATKAKLESRRNTALAFYGKQADALDADGVKKMRAELEADFADGGIAGLDGEGWSTLNRSLEKLETAKRTGDKRKTDDFRERGDRLAFRLLAGVDINQAELSQMMLDAGTTPGGQAVMQETFAKISAGRAIRDMSLPAAEKHLAGLRKQYGDKPKESELRTLAFAEKMVTEKRKAISTDSVSYAESQGIVPQTPLLTDAATAEDMSTIMSARAKAAEQAAVELGAPVRYLKAGEAAALGKAIRANPEAGAAMAGAIVAGAGSAAPQVLSEFGQDAPMIVEAGAIIAGDGSARAAEDVILGYGKGPDGKVYKDVKPAIASENFNRVAGDALALAGKDRGRIANAAAAISRKRIAELGLDPESDEAIEIHSQAVQEAAGAVFDRGVQFGGFATVGGTLFGGGDKVMIPSAIRADLFDDVLQAITDEDLAALPVTPKAGIGSRAVGFGLAPIVERTQRSMAATLRDARPVAVSGGFAFALGDPASPDPQWIMGSDGNPYVLDVVAMRDRLAPRVPGAFR